MRKGWLLVVVLVTLLATVGLAVLIVGQCSFAVNLAKLLRGVCEPLCRSICSTVCGWTPGVAKAEVKP